MTVLFMNMRLIGYLSTFLLSAAVLGLTANFAKLFLPDINHDFTIFALIPPSVTLFAFLCLTQFAQPVVEVTVHFILAVLWLAMGAWSEDIIGYVQCYQLPGLQPTNKGTMTLQTYCYQMKVIEALSWTIFVLFALFFIMLIALTSRAVAFGRYYAWREHVSQLGWFGEFPGYPTEAVYPRAPFYGGYGQNPMMGGYHVQQMPGHSIMVQPGVNGGQPVVTQVPGVV
ncbi:hypothetical protein DFH29DRAFT_885164 [Suillus ampliporus]|nr:hypothetical protein DFH29DRAFT_885164 [Suillus ampliporus]